MLIYHFLSLMERKFARAAVGIWSDFALILKTEDRPIGLGVFSRSKSSRPFLRSSSSREGWIRRKQVSDDNFALGGIFLNYEHRY